MIYTLIDLLSKYSVKIPMIQRDYAQGRLDRKSVLDSILGEIKNSLDSKKPLTFDYVYGVIETTESKETTFYPLDGQQRLTTLWLVHWYIALKTDKLKETNLGKFVYEIRESSTDFFKELVKLDKSAIPNGKGLVGFIQDQTWFYKSWLQDPTVSALLNAIDVVEELFSKKTTRDFEDYWTLLAPHNVNRGLISFELLELKSDSSTDGNNGLYISLSSADDLFVKMNARGKPLTEFENFKSDWDSNLNLNIRQTEYTTKIDTVWMDVFWTLAKDDSNKDKDTVTYAGELFFQFINRFILNKIVLSLDSSKVNSKLIENASIDSLMDSDIKTKLKEYSDGKLAVSDQSEFETFKHVHAFKYIYDYIKCNDSGYKGSGKGLDIYPEYLTFLDYKDYLDFHTMDEINSILTLIKAESDKDSSFMSNIDNIFCELGIKDFSFMRDNTNGDYTQEQRIFFFAACRFFLICNKYNRFDISLYDNWMQVIRNIIVNSDIRSEAATYNGLKLVETLANTINPPDLDIYRALTSISPNDKSSLMKERLSEEILKARAICQDNTNKLRELLKTAENSYFFKGVIEFLYKDEDDKTDFDYDRIYKRVSNLKNLKLDKNGATDETIRMLLEKYGGFEEIKNMFLIIRKGFNQKHNELSFRDNILCGNLSGSEKDRLENDETEITKRHKQRRKFIEDILSTNPIVSTNTATSNLVDLYLGFINSKALKIMISESEGKYMYEAYGNMHRFKKISTGNQKNHGIYIDDHRIQKSKLLHDLIVNNKVEIDEESYPYIDLGSRGLYWGLEISFVYKDNSENKRFEWVVDYNENTGETKELIKYKPNKLPEQMKEWALNSDLESILKSF